MMPAPKGHPPYPGCEKGACYGLLGKPDDSWTEEEAIKLGQELIQWFFITRNNIWVKSFFSEEKGMLHESVDLLERRFPSFKKFICRARQLQESRLASMPLDKSKKGIDGYHARWMLARHHKGEWEDKPTMIKEEEVEVLNKSMSLVDHLQSSVDGKSDLKIEESNINNAQ